MLHEPPGRPPSGTVATSALTVCRSGHRAAMAASILAGAEDVLRGS